MKITIKIKCELFPGPAMVARGLRVAAAVAAAPGAAAAGTAGGAFAVAVLIIGGTAYAIQQAKEESDKFTRLLAQREGASSRVAWVIIGKDAEVAFLERRSRWRTPQMNLLKPFDDGRRRIDDKLGTPDELAAKTKAWTTRFASDGTQDFTLIRERVFQAVGAYNKDGEIGDGLAAL